MQAFEKKLKEKLSLRTILNPIGAIIIAIIATSIFLIAMGKNPIEAFYYLLYGAFGSVSAITETLVTTTSLLLLGLGLTFAFKCKFANIGAEGQLYMGAWLTTFVAISFSGLPGIVLFPLVLLAGFIGGAVWAVVPGLLKVKLGANEVVTTMMFNFIAALWVNYMVFGPMRSGYLPQSAPVPSSVFMPILVSGTRLNAGFLIAILATIFTYVILSKTVFGYRLKVVGENTNVAKYAGISIVKSVAIVALISGGLAGLGGSSLVLGVFHELENDISAGYGFLAIAVAYLGKLEPIGVFFSAIFYAAILNGSTAMEQYTGVYVSTYYIIAALVLLAVAGDVYMLISKRLQKHAS